MSKLRLLAGMMAMALLVACAPTPKPTRPTGPPPGAKIDRVLVLKGQRELRLLAQGYTVKTYPVSLGFAPQGHKIQSGDGRTPEGVYMVDRRNPNSQFYRSLGISYPGPADRARARTLGVDPGGDIMIHGLPNGREWVGTEHRRFDWTEGCIAVTNEEMDEIWALVDEGTPIEIRP